MTKSEMIKALKSQFIRDNKRSKFIAEELKSLEIFWGKKSIEDLTETYKRTTAIANVTEYDRKRHCQFAGLN